MNVLLVDDEQNILDILEDFLHSHIDGLTIYKAMNGEQGVALENNIDMNVVVTDYKMPIMDGHELSCHIREKGRNKEVPIIFLSGFIPELKSLEGMIDDVFFLEKPDGIDQVPTYIKRIKKAQS